MTHHPKFSVLVANYNNGRYFADCYQSLLQQTFTDWECIIVDDCSTDNSLHIIKEIIGDDARFQLYCNEENKGCGYTKRRCVELAKGEFCGYLDPDDMLEDNAIEVVLEAFEKEEDIVLVHSKWKSYDSQWNFLQEYQAGKQIEYTKEFLNLQGEITQFAAFKKSAYLCTEGVNENFLRAVDIDLYLKLCEVGKTRYLDKFLYKYRIHDNGISTGSNVYKAYYWRWFANMNASMRRRINLEHIFAEHVVKKSDYQALKNNYYQLKKFEPIQNFIKRFKK